MEEIKIYVASNNSYQRQQIFEFLVHVEGNKRVVKNKKDANLFLLEDGYFKSAELTEIFHEGLRRNVTIKHFGGDETKDYLFSIVKRLVSLEGFISKSRLREHVICRSAICCFLLKCGIHETDVAKFVNRDRSTMFHYAKNHSYEMKNTPLYQTIFNALMMNI